jgi:hypothetical protein
MTSSVSPISSTPTSIAFNEPGGDLSANYGRRSGAEAAQNDAVAKYDALVAHTQTVFAGLRAARLATEESVTQVIYDAATEGTDRLRYVATEDIKPLVKARRESSEEDYIAFMRARSAPKPNHAPCRTVISNVK